MDKKLEQTLANKFPSIFRDYKTDIRKSPMGWGVTCGNGWFKLIYKLCEKLSKYDNIIAVQVKEKFGGLRFYISNYDVNKFDEIHNIIHQIEQESFKTCEFCGQKGELRKHFWIMTLCDKCNNLLKDGYLPHKNPEMFPSVYNELLEEGFIEQDKK